MGKINMDTIAAIAGVSKATVSRALRSPHLVKESTRRRIQSIVEEQKYVYNMSAADFSSNTTTLIGLLITSVKSSIFADFIDGIESVVRDTRYSLLIGYTNFDDREEESLVRTFLQRKVCGLIAVGIDDHNEGLYKQALDHGTAVVNTWEYSADSALNCVGFDNAKAAYEMTRYLTGLGHERIGIIMGPFTEARRVRKRYEGFERAMQEAGLEVRPEYVIEKHPTFIEGQEGMNRLLDLKAPPTAVFAASDTLAIGAVKAIRDRGMRVPDDISVAGFDNVDISYFFSPALTTVRVPAAEMGRIAAQVILDSVEKDNPTPRKYCLDTDLILRESCRAMDRPKVVTQ